MRQVVQNFRSGELAVEEVPESMVRSGGLLVANACSLISAGTEKSTVSVARKSLLGKALERPEMARKVLAKARKDGIADTVRMVFQRLDSPVALGYSCAGVVADVGREVTGFAVGDRVACAGQGYASHAELVYVPKNLCARIPDGVEFEDAAYVTLGAIALQSVRQVEPRLGDLVVVIGLGLLGQLTVQLLKANGCRVIAADLAPEKLALARTFGADDAVLPADLLDAGRSASRGHGVDAVIIAASTRDNGPIELAGELCRKKGRVVVLGAVGMNLPREPYYQKELELRLSMSYGPGRYDPQYEEKGHDYPYGYVRWTEQRNMEAFLWLLASGAVNVRPLTTHRYSIEDADAAYQMMLDGTDPYLGIVLSYGAGGAPREPAVALTSPPEVAPAVRPARLALGLIGAGNHVRDMLLPHLIGAERVDLRWVCTGSGIQANAIGSKLGVANRTADYREVLADPQVNAVLIGTRHGSHAAMTLAAMRAGKHVFVEKPLCLNLEELASIEAEWPAFERAGGRLLVGFNRRYSEHAVRVRDCFAGRREPLVMVYRINAGAIPREHWIHDPADGGGRIVGEACHFLDLMQFVCGAVPTTVRGRAIGSHSSGITEDQAILTFGFADGSVGTIVYAAGGDSALDKERLEVFGAGRAAVLEDFASTHVYRAGKPERFATGKRDKGFAAEMQAFRATVLDGTESPMPFAQIVAASRGVILAARCLVTGDDYAI